jgi:hypothetical protein
MAVAKFGPTAEWAGKKITREGDIFVVQGDGEISPLVIMENDRQGHLIWVNDGTHAWSARSRETSSSGQHGLKSEDLSTAPSRMKTARRPERTLAGPTRGVSR